MKKQTRERIRKEIGDVLFEEWQRRATHEYHREQINEMSVKQYSDIYVAHQYFKVLKQRQGF